MQPGTHAVVSLSLGVLLWAWTQSICASLLCFVSGTLIDLDHIVEYGIHYGRKWMNLREVFHYYNTRSALDPGSPSPRLYFFLHAYEYAVLFWIFFLLTRNVCVFGLALGYTLHMIMDGLGNRDRVLPFHYFLLVRLMGKR